MNDEPVFDPLRERLQEKKKPDSTARTPVLLLTLVIISLGMNLILGLLMLQLNKNFTVQKEELESRMAALSSTIGTIREQAEEKVNRSLQEVQSSLESTREEVVGMARTEVAQARRQTQLVKEQQDEAVETLSSRIQTKADAEQLEELAQQASQQFQEIGQQISTVEEDVAASRSELEETLKELSALGLQVTEQGNLIAVNTEGVQELRRRGERDYFEFSIVKDRRITLAGIGLELRRTNRKGQHANLDLFVDDKKMELRKVYANAPVDFLVGAQRIPYELVLNTVDRNQVNGYISVPSGAVPGTVELKRPGR